jgi:hypothetical protein
MNKFAERDAATGATVPLASSALQEPAYRLIEALNARLLAERERAQNRVLPGMFGFLGLLLLLGVGLSTVNIAWGPLVLIIIGGAICAFFAGLGVVLRLERRYATIAYQQIIQPEIAAFCAAHSCSPQQLSVLAHEILPQDAPLRNFLFQASPDAD